MGKVTAWVLAVVLSAMEAANASAQSCTVRVEVWPATPTFEPDDTLLLDDCRGSPPHYRCALSRGEKFNVTNTREGQFEQRRKSGQDWENWVHGKARNDQFGFFVEGWAQEEDRYHRLSSNNPLMTCSWRSSPPGGGQTVGGGQRRAGGQTSGGGQR